MVAEAGSLVAGACVLVAEARAVVEAELDAEARWPEPVVAGASWWPEPLVAEAWWPEPAAAEARYASSGACGRCHVRCGEARAHGAVL